MIDCPRDMMGWLTRSVDDLEFSARTAGTLRRMGIERIGQILEHQPIEFLRQPNFGNHAMRELIEVMFPLGFSTCSMRPDKALSFQYHRWVARPDAGPYVAGLPARFPWTRCSCGEFADRSPEMDDQFRDFGEDDE